MLYKKGTTADQILQNLKKYRNFHPLIFPKDIFNCKEKFNIIFLINVPTVMPIPIERICLILIIRNLLLDNGIFVWYSDPMIRNKKQKYTRKFIDGYLTGSNKKKIETFYKELHEDEIETLIELSGFKIDKKKSKQFQISKSCNIPCRYVKNILLEELGEEYSNYLFPNIYENVKKRLEEEQIRKIINLRNSGKNVKEISAEAGFSEDFIKFIIVGETNENLKYRGEKYRLGIRSEESVLRYLHEIYDNFVKEILALKHESLEDVNSIIEEVQEFQQLKPQCSSRFLTIWKKMSKYSKYRSPDRLCPPFIFSFFKANNIHVTSKFFLRQYRFSRHEWNESLRRIFRHFPAFRHRNRAQVVMGRITEVKDFFNLSSEFHRNSMVLLEKLWNYLSTTTDDVVAGTICTLSLLSIKNDTITISKVCKRIGISHSSVIYQIKYKLFKALKIPGFNTLKSSKELIRSEIFEKIVGLENLR